MSGSVEFARTGKGKQGIVGRNAGGSLFYVGAVYSPEAAQRLAEEARAAGYEVELCGAFSMAEFRDAVRSRGGHR